MTRPESGPMRFGDDWMGLFLRGDRAGPLAMYLRDVLDDIGAGREPDYVSLMHVRGLVQMLSSCDERHEPKDVHVLRPFVECMPGGERAG